MSPIIKAIYTSFLITGQKVKTPLDAQYELIQCAELLMYSGVEDEKNIFMIALELLDEYNNG